ncbi:MAG: AAA family ATPase [Treponema sp.]|nr:AAA family ATPase [Treponema sp.]
MTELETKVRVPFLWGKSVFKKSRWSQINLIVGPNGSGKTILATELTKQFEASGKSVKFISAERDSDNISILRDNEKIRTKTEKVLSEMFGKSITFIEDIDGTFIPIVRNRAWNVEYMMEDAECHGLQKIISLLINLYSSTTDIVIFDEPELHLHPQFQLFFMNEIRQEAKHHVNKLFFLITHSPFFIDLRTPEDLEGVIVCHINRPPTHIEELLREDEALFKRFLPRFNTYHKQFFFSDNQIFVEGYTDQQLFTYLLPYVENKANIAGTSVIDVGGKDELGVFCKVCSLIGTDARIITDLDSLFSGKLRDVVCRDERVEGWLEKQTEKQEAFFQKIFSAKERAMPITLDKLIFRLERYILAIGTEITETFWGPSTGSGTPDEHSRTTDVQSGIKAGVPEALEGHSHKFNPETKLWLTKLAALQTKHENADAVDTYKTVLLQGILKNTEDLSKILSEPLAATLPVIKNLSSLIFAAAESARVYILHKGCIEHYYTRSVVNYMPVSGKDKLFREELDFIMDTRPKIVRKQYEPLIFLLEAATSK